MTMQRPASSAGGSDQALDPLELVCRRLRDLVDQRAYLRAAVVNRCLAWRGRQALEREHRPATPETELASADPEIRDLLRKLPVDQRVALVLRFYEDLTGAQIADVMQLPPSTVRSHIHRGLATLNELIES